MPSTDLIQLPLMTREEVEVIDQLGSGQVFIFASQRELAQSVKDKARNALHGEAGEGADQPVPEEQGEDDGDMASGFAQAIASQPRAESYRESIGATDDRLATSTPQGPPPPDSLEGERLEPHVETLAYMQAAARVRDGRWVAGAPSHIFAEFARALNESGYRLTQQPAEPTVDEGDER